MSRWPGGVARDRLPIQAPPPTPSVSDLVTELSRLSRSLDVALDELRSSSSAYAVAEDRYRLARATHQLDAKGALEAQGRKAPTVDECKAHVDLLTSKERVEAHIAEGMRDCAREAVRSRIAQMSCLQSVAAAVRGEMEFARRSPGP